MLVNSNFSNSKFYHLFSCNNNVIVMMNLLKMFNICKRNHRIGDASHEGLWNIKFDSIVVGYLSRHCTFETCLDLLILHKEDSSTVVSSQKFPKNIVNCC